MPVGEHVFEIACDLADILGGVCLDCNASVGGIEEGLPNSAAALEAQPAIVERAVVGFGGTPVGAFIFGPPLPFDVDDRLQQFDLGDLLPNRQGVSVDIGSIGRRILVAHLTAHPEGIVGVSVGTVVYIRTIEKIEGRYRKPTEQFM